MRLLYMFNIGLVSHVANGNNSLFWSDRWLMGCCISDLAPTVVEAVPLKTRQQRTVAEALLEQAWPADIQGCLSLSMIGLEYFQLWDTMQDILLSQEDDQHSCKTSCCLKTSWQFTSMSAYRALMDPLHLNHGCESGRPGILESARYSCGWPSATDVGRQTVYRREDSLTRINVSYATRKWRLCNTFSLHVCLRAISGSRSWLHWTSFLMNTGGVSPYWLLLI